jgi:anaerobic ribonucleoside-triphosphate reductase
MKILNNDRVFEGGARVGKCLIFTSMIQYIKVGFMVTTGSPLLQHAHLYSRRSGILVFYGFMPRDRKKENCSRLQTKKMGDTDNGNNSPNPPFSTTSQASTTISLARNINYCMSVHLKDLLNRTDWIPKYALDSYLS